MGAETLTYGVLAERSNRLAHHLLGLGVSPESAVGVCLERSLDLVVTLLGVMKAGAAYLPLDPSYPSERLAFMLSDAGAAVLVTRSGLAEHFEAFTGQRVLLDEAGPAIARCPSESPGEREWSGEASRT